MTSSATPSSTSTANATSSTPTSEKSEKPQPVPSRRRDKPQLSCNLCRRRKLKCDRGNPCETCARRGLSLSCTYVAISTPGQTTSLNRGTGSSNLHERIEQLEKLVISLANSRNAAKPPDQQSSSIIPDDKEAENGITSNSENLAENLGRINLDNEEANYVESTHWTAILDGISELKDSFDGGIELEMVQKTLANLQEIPRMTLFNPSEHTISKQEILSAIPTKATVDKRIANCFINSEVLHILFHAPTFQKQYDNFWKQPHSTPIMWIGILYGLMFLATHHEVFSVSAPGQNSNSTFLIEAQQRLEMYRRRMIQCMVLGGYTKGVPHTMETLQLYMQVEYLGKPDSPTEFWLLLGIIIRLAFRLGYHRDGSHFPSITPFEAEMRRRRWCLIFQMETMASTQFGLPKMIKESQTDVTPPHNLFDEDFDESTTNLPESRPVTTITPILYIITKTKLFSIFGQISELNLQTTQVPLTEVMKLDKMLNDYQETIPPGYKMRSMTQSIIDKPELIFQRLWIATLYLKNKCILHRRYLRIGRLDSRFIYSRNACIDSALQILKLQNLLYEECLPNGRLYQDRWRTTSLMKQEFLLATAILCVDVYADIELEVSPADHKDQVDKQSRYRILGALKIAQSIWEQESGDSLEARKATQVLQLVLKKASMIEEGLRSHEGKIPSAAYVSKNTDGFPTVFSSSAELNFSLTEGLPISEWQPFTSTSLLTHTTDNGVMFNEPLADSVDFSTILNDFPQQDWQAQDLMDILQDDYPDMIL